MSSVNTLSELVDSRIKSKRTLTPPNHPRNLKAPEQNSSVKFNDSSLCKLDGSFVRVDSINIWRHNHENNSKRHIFIDENMEIVV